MRAPTSNGLDLPMAKFRHIEKQFRHTKNMRNSIRNRRNASRSEENCPLSTCTRHGITELMPE